MAEEAPSLRPLPHCPFSLTEKKTKLCTLYMLRPNKCLSPCRQGTITLVFIQQFPYKGWIPDRGDTLR